MSELNVNTEAIATAADNIDDINGLIHDRFIDLQKEVAKLKGEWQSPASETVMNKFDEIKTCFEDERYTVLQNYVRFLRDVVGVGYEQTEDVNKSLSEAFK